MTRLTPLDSIADTLLPRSHAFRRVPKHVLDLFAGLGGFSAAFADDADWEVTTVDIDDRFDPDIQADVLDLRHDDFDRDFDVVLAGHPCTIFSTANLGHHLDPDNRPKTETAEHDLAMLFHTIGLIRALDPEYWFLENPKGRLRTVYRRPEGTVWYCQFGSDYAKPTDLWGRHPDSFEYLSCKRGADDCDHVKTSGYSKGSDASKQLQGVLTERDPAERAKVPYGLSEAIRDAIEDPESEQSSVVDF